MRGRPVTTWSISMYDSWPPSGSGAFAHAETEGHQHFRGRRKLNDLDSGRLGLAVAIVIERDFRADIEHGGNVHQAARVGDVVSGELHHDVVSLQARTVGRGARKHSLNQRAWLFGR